MTLSCVASWDLRSIDSLSVVDSLSRFSEISGTGVVYGNRK